MRYLPPLLAILAVCLLCSCDSGGGFQAADSQPPAFVQKLWVDAVHGSDQNTGGELDPFRTITHALSVISPNGQVFVRRGLYDDAHGETFPMTVPATVDLMAPLAQPASVRIVAPSVGSAVVLASDSRLFGFLVSNPQTATSDTTGVEVTGTGVAIERCTVRDAQWGIRTLSGSGGLVADSIVLENDWGMRLFGAWRAESNMVRDNVLGIGVGGSGADLGGGGQGSLGLNTFLCNGIHVYAAQGNAPGYTAFAQHNYWDAIPIDVVEIDNDLALLALAGTPGEIVHTPTSTVLTAPAYAGPSCP